MLAGHEADQRAVRVTRDGVVVDLADPFAGRETRAGQSVRAPERCLVDGLSLDHQAHGLMLVADLLHAAGHALVEQDALIDEVLELPRRGDHQHGL
ncbi:Uncharacterised protein [Mycobacteroides abscessus subsp. abscessus]|nr:Uncharacterised protein [Mycobacteroides abscessus subsp. abscessus]